jgi:hypothetical protein
LLIGSDEFDWIIEYFDGIILTMYRPEETYDALSILRAKKTYLKRSFDYVERLLNTGFNGFHDSLFIPP